MEGLEEYNVEIPSPLDQWGDLADMGTTHVCTDFMTAKLIANNKSGTSDVWVGLQKYYHNLEYQKNIKWDAASFYSMMNHMIRFNELHRTHPHLSLKLQRKEHNDYLKLASWKGSKNIL
jgi:hypothetical protein